MLKKGSLTNLDVALSAVQLNQGGGGYNRQERQMFPAIYVTCEKETLF